MKTGSAFTLALAMTVGLLTIAVVAQSDPAASSAASKDKLAAHLIDPQDLVKVIQDSKGEKPLILNVGPSLLYMQAHIPASEYIGAGSTPQGIESLRRRVKAVPHNAAIILYCGCCPWSHCPNVLPAYNELQKIGFSNVKVLYIADNFGADWVDKGYPTVRGQ
jgi:thiosulfate/3-mercaptopyruvate sulfurtransferase